MEPFVNEVMKYRMTDEDFGKLSSFVSKELGIKMPYPKKLMLQGRLQKRLADLRLNSFKEYLDFVFSKKGREVEMVKMIDRITTNKTDFFRESQHFDYLKSMVFPELVSKGYARRTIRIWSAGCSSGEEPYSIAIVMKEFLQDHPETDFEIFATDISLSILEKASTAVYSSDRISCISTELKKKYFLKSKDPSEKLVRLVSGIRSKVTFQRMNLMNPYYSVNKEFDIIFCRNVLIYFDHETQQNVITKLASNLKPDGFFFLGHSESVTNMNVPLKQIKPTIFRKA
jgi:chemotaxis protein methyltransferase CheR